MRKIKFLTVIGVLLCSVTLISYGQQNGQHTTQKMTAKVATMNQINGSLHSGINSTIVPTTTTVQGTFNAHPNANGTFQTRANSTLNLTPLTLQGSKSFTVVPNAVSTAAENRTQVTKAQRKAARIQALNNNVNIGDIKAKINKLN